MYAQRARPVAHRSPLAAPQETLLQSADALPECTAMYFVPEDGVLAYAFASATSSRAVGCSGLSDGGAREMGRKHAVRHVRAPPQPRVGGAAGQPRLVLVDASACFDVWVHNEYRSRFHAMAADFRPTASPAALPP